MDASDYVAAIALLVSAVSLWFAYQSNWRETRRFKREEEDAETAQRARLAAEYVETIDEPGRDTYVLDVTNTGRAPAHHVIVRVVDMWGHDVGTTKVGMPLLPGETRRFKIRRTAAAWRPPLTPVFEWRNSTDEPEVQRSSLVFDRTLDDDASEDAMMLDLSDA